MSRRDAVHRVGHCGSPSQQKRATCPGGCQDVGGLSEAFNERTSIEARNSRLFLASGSCGWPGKGCGIYVNILIKGN